MDSKVTVMTYEGDSPLDWSLEEVQAAVERVWQLAEVKNDAEEPDEP